MKGSTSKQIHHLTEVKLLPHGSEKRRVYASIIGGARGRGGGIRFDVSLVFTRLKALGFIKSFKLYDVLKATGLRERPCPSY